jgi:hypothetical protein
MRIIDRHETEVWLSARGLVDSKGMLSLSAYFTQAPYTIPPDSGKKTALSRTIVSFFRDQNEALLWINEFGIWPSSEDRHLFTGFRQSLGEHSPLPEKPGHLFSAIDLETVGSLLAMALYFCWGAVLVSASGDFLLRVTHDEQIHTYARDEVDLSKIHTLLSSLPDK